MTVTITRRGVALLLGTALVAGACGASTPSATPAPVATEAPAATVAPTATIAATPAPTPSPTPTPTPAPTPSPTPAPTEAPTPTPAPSSGQVQLPTGRTGRIELSEIGLTLTLPRHWRSIPLDAKDLAKVLDALPKGTLPAGFESQIATMIASGLRLFAVDVDSGNAGANVNVLWMSLAMTTTQMRAASEFGMSQLNAIRSVTYREVRIDGVAAVRVDYSLALANGSTKLTGTGVQIWVPTGRGTAVITITTPKGGRIKDADELVKSLRID